MQANNFLDQFYTIDPHTGNYIVEIALNDYDDIFNSWDSSVYNIRDLDNSLKKFLVDCAYDIDDRKKIIMRFNMTDEKRDPIMEENIIGGIRNYFNYCIYMLQQEFSYRKGRALIYVVTSLAFTVTSVYLQSIVETELLKEIVLLSLTVGGWVFLWEAFSQIFIQSSDLRRRRAQYERIRRAPIMFNYK